MQHLEVCGALRLIYLYIYIYIIRRLNVKRDCLCITTFTPQDLILSKINPVHIKDLCSKVKNTFWPKAGVYLLSHMKPPVIIPCFVLHSRGTWEPNQCLWNYRTTFFAAWRLWRFKAQLVRLPANQCKSLFSFLLFVLQTGLHATPAQLLSNLIIQTRQARQRQLFIRARKALLTANM